MKERPILFQGAMVRAILDGTKTQTRRIVKPAPPSDFNLLTHRSDAGWVYAADYSKLQWENAHRIRWECPQGQPGDRLWVREAHWWFKDEPDHETGYYPPTLTVEDVEFRADGDDGRKVWRPSIHMPRWASRITLEITGVRVERLQDISEADAIAEGIEADVQPGDAAPLWRNYSTGNTTICPVYSYQTLWESINGPGSWEANPWVWVVEFRRAAS